jgi:hypothetical protein
MHFVPLNIWDTAEMTVSLGFSGAFCRYCDVSGFKPE